MFASVVRVLQPATRLPSLNGRMFHASARAQKHYLDGDFATFKEVTAGNDAQNRIALVDFYADWCGPCRLLTPVLKEVTSGDTTGLTSSGLPVDLVTINSDSQDGIDIGTRYNVRALPTVLAFVRGKKIAQFTGAISRPQLDAFLKSL